MIRIFALIISLFSLLLPVSALDAMQTSTFSDFDILAANKLDYTDGQTKLIGDVQVKFGAFTISAPEVLLHTDADSKPNIIEFLGEVELESKDLNILADRIEIDFGTNLFKAYAGKEKVLSTLKGKDPIYITSDYQDYNLETGLAHAESKSEDQVMFKNIDRTIYSNNSELQYTEGAGNKVEYVDFTGDVVLIEADKRIESQDLLYLTVQDTMKAYTDVKIVYESEKQGLIHLFADNVVYENKLDLLSAFSKGTDANVSIYAKEMYGKGRQLVMQSASTDAEKAVLSGTAYAQLNEKAVSGDEILFDIQNQELITLVGRPSTKFLSNK